MADIQRPIGDQWDSYRAVVVPHDAPPSQLTDCRRAFYAGAESMRRVLLAAPDDEAAELAVCGNVEADLVAFGQEVLRGEA